MGMIERIIGLVNEHSEERETISVSGKYTDEEVLDGIIDVFQNQMINKHKLLQIKISEVKRADDGRNKRIQILYRKVK